MRRNHRSGTKSSFMTYSAFVLYDPGISWHFAIEPEVFFLTMYRFPWKCCSRLVMGGMRARALNGNERDKSGRFLCTGATRTYTKCDNKSAMGLMCCRSVVPFLLGYVPHLKLIKFYACSPACYFGCGWAQLCETIDC